MRKGFCAYAVQKPLRGLQLFIIMREKKLFVFILVIFLLIGSFPKVLAIDNNFVKVFKRAGGVTTGIIVSPIVGSLRGFLKGWQNGTDFTAVVLGNKNGSMERSISFISGGPLFSTYGLIFGLLMGAHDGIVYGISDPFSKQNFSLQGNSLLDYKLLD